MTGEGGNGGRGGDDGASVGTAGHSHFRWISPSSFLPPSSRRHSSLFPLSFRVSSLPLVIPGERSETRNPYHEKLFTFKFQPENPGDAAVSV